MKAEGAKRGVFRENRGPEAIFSQVRGGCKDSAPPPESGKLCKSGPVEPVFRPLGGVPPRSQFFFAPKSSSGVGGAAQKLYSGSQKTPIFGLFWGVEVGSIGVNIIQARANP